MSAVAFFMTPFQTIQIIKERTNQVILFHSGTGKDSICLCDMLSKNFDKIYCVFMYLVKGLDYENRYLNFAIKTYPNIEFIQVPHFCLSSFVKHGYLGIKKDHSIQKDSISKIDKFVKVKFKTDYSVYGFKKVDGMNRRLMLNGLENNIYDSTRKVYPLACWKNSDCLKYIDDNNLIKPFVYDPKRPSSGCDISHPLFLNHIRQKYPEDLKKIFAQFPGCEVILFKFDTYGQES